MNRSLQPWSEKKNMKRKKKNNNNNNHSFPSLVRCSSKSKSKEEEEEVALPAPGRPAGITNTIVTYKKTTTTTTETSIVKTCYNKAAEGNAYNKIRIYFCTATYAGAGDGSKFFDWYKINPKKRTNHSKDPPVLNPVTRMPSSTPSDFGTTAVGSKLYALGGYNRNQDKGPSSQFLVCDTSSSQKPIVWEECFPPMSSPRKDPTAVNVHGNVLVFGSRGGELNDPWSELFDTNSNTWNRLAPPPSLPPYPSYGGVVTSVFSQERGEVIVLMDHCQLYCFNVTTLSWNKIPVNIPHDSISTGSIVIVDNILYWFFQSNLWAFDMSSSSSRPQVVRGLDEEISDHITHTCKGHLFYIGEGKLCLIWYRGLNDPTYNLLIHCLRFWVGASEHHPFSAVIDRHESYLAQGLTAKGFVAISGEKL